MKMFLFENVRGLLTHDRGKTYATMLEIFANAGYTIVKQVLNAWDYGAPQKRERLITIGIRNDLADKTEYRFPKPHEYKPVLRDVLLDCPEGPGVPYGEKKRKIFELVPPGGYWRDIDPEVAKEYMKSCWEMEGGRTGILRRMSLDEPSLTVLTSPSQKQTERCHPLEARPFTVRENARCQMFPDEWEFCGNVSSQYKQVGNAATIEKYGEKLELFDIKRFNKNIVDPIKLIFDKTVYLDAFYQMCMILPGAISDVVINSESKVPHDTVWEELKNIANLMGEMEEDIAMSIAIYLLGFNSYNGFAKLIQGKEEPDENMLKRIYAYAKGISGC